MRYFIIFFLLTTQTAVAQEKDSILLKPVVVYGNPEQKYLTGSNLMALDSVLQRHERSSHLGDMLSLQFPAYFRNYGNGMISGISMRGTAPQHTAVLWNGININSFSLGQADFSIMPAAAFGDIKVHEGAGSARFGSGAFGGTVLLNSRTSEENSLSIAQEVASFHRYFTNVNGSFSKTGWTLKSNFYHQKSENDFPVKGSDIRQPHAAFMQRGFVQDVSYNISSGKNIALHYWLHQSDREIQPSVGQVNGNNNEQQDKNHRLILKYNANGGPGLTALQAGYIQDVIVYNGDRSTIARLTGKASHQFIAFRKINVEFGGEVNHIEAVVKQYNKDVVKENRYDVTGAFFYKLSPALFLAMNLRQPFVEGFHSPFLPYAGFEYLLWRGKNPLKITGNVSRNFRAPTLNDRYWQSSGSRSLQPEISLASEAGYTYTVRKFSLRHTAFAQRVDQWIQWEPKRDENGEPQSTGEWEPKNLMQVIVKGMQINLQYQHPIGKINIKAFLNGQAARSVVTKASPQKMHTIGQQLIYTPVYTGAANVQVAYEKYLVSGSVHFNGRRYIITSNDIGYSLPLFANYQVSLSTHYNFNRHRFDVNLVVRNLSDVNYQLYSGRAMPPRNYSLTLTYQLNQKNPN